MKTNSRMRSEGPQTKFIAEISHELRTPIAIIKGAIENLKYGLSGALSEKQARVFEVIARNVDCLNHLVCNVLDLSRLESGRAKMNLQSVDITQVIEEVIQSMDPQAQEKGIRITSSHSEGLPDVWADPDLITQVMTNLLSNAIRFAKSHIIIETSEVRDQVQVSVKDDGPGIPLEYQSKIFDKFEQVTRPVGGTQYKGTGLGLSICREILENHRGKILVENHEGEGASFIFRLPQHDALEALRTEFEVVLP